LTKNTGLVHEHVMQLLQMSTYSRSSAKITQLYLLWKQGNINVMVKLTISKIRPPIQLN